MDNRAIGRFCRCRMRSADSASAFPLGPLIFLCKGDDFILCSVTSCRRWRAYATTTFDSSCVQLSTRTPYTTSSMVRPSLEACITIRTHLNVSRQADKLKAFIFRFSGASLLESYAPPFRPRHPPISQLVGQNSGTFDSRERH